MSHKITLGYRPTDRTNQVVSMMILGLRDPGFDSQQDLLHKHKP